MIGVVIVWRTLVLVYVLVTIFGDFKEEDKVLEPPMYKLYRALLAFILVMCLGIIGAFLDVKIEKRQWQKRKNKLKPSLARRFAKNVKDTFEEDERFRSEKDEPVLTKEQYRETVREVIGAKKIEVLNNGGWKCAKCGKVNFKHITSCTCGTAKWENDNVKAGGWKCKKCGDVHQSTEYGCRCGYINEALWVKNGNPVLSDSDLRKAIFNSES